MNDEMKKIKKIGLTGGIASGKSFVSDMLKEMGANVIDADQVYGELILPGRFLYEAIRQNWGDEILAFDGKIDRKKLATLVFSSKKDRLLLNDLTHPAVIEDIKERLDAANNLISVVVAPLLIEAGQTEIVDQIWLVVIDEETQLERLMKRESISHEDAVKRVRSQMPQDEKRKYADRIIDNNGTPENTREQVMMIWKEIGGLSLYGTS